MRYFELNSEAQAEKISRLLFSLMYPESGSAGATHLFRWFTMSGVALIEINETQLCPVFPKTITDTVLADLVSTFGAKIPSKDRAKYRDYIKNNSQVLLINLIPSTLQEYTQQWVDDNSTKP